MCVFCFKELKRWCKSFTKPEICLSLLEAVFLIILVTSLTFLVQHFLACASRNVNEHVNTSTTFRHETTVPAIIPDQTKYYKQTTHKTFPPGIKCTWKPSKKTRPTMRFFEYNQTESSFYELGIIQSGKLNISQAKSTPDTISDILGKDKKFDGEYAEDSFNNHVLALVKFKPPKDIIFGCILTIISEFWTITAASCIDAIEELDSLDSFVMLEDYGLEKKGQIHTLSDVQVHPFYQNGNKSYDLSVLKSEDSLTSGSRFPVELPNIIDYFLITVGESFTMLGFGPLRTIDKSLSGHRLHKAYVYNLSTRQCRSTDDTWSLRHLQSGSALLQGGCGRSALCAGVLWSRNAPCNYCAGTPLLSESLLLGVMSDNQQCGVSCDPQIYVNIAMLRDWIDFIIGNK